MSSYWAYPILMYKREIYLDLKRGEVQTCEIKSGEFQFKEIVSVFSTKDD